MSKASIERKLTDLSKETRSLRGELNVLDEQLKHFADEAEDTRLRAMISETPLASREHRDASRTVSALTKDLEIKAERLRSLEAEQDELLDQLGLL